MHDSCFPSLHSGVVVFFLDHVRTRKGEKEAWRGRYWKSKKYIFVPFFLSKCA